LYDTDPTNFDADVWGVYQTTSSITFDQYQKLLSQYNLDCFPAPKSVQDGLYDFVSKNFTFPIWVCGGVLYKDGWFSYSDCSYIAYDGSVWKVKNNACSDPNKVWQKIGAKCYVSSWKHTIRFQDGSTASLNWDVSLPQDKFDQTQQFSVGGKNYKINLKCSSSTTVVDEVKGSQLVLCTAFSESVYDSQGSLLYQLSWSVDSTWPCSVSALNQSSSQTSESLTPNSTSQFNGVVLERPNNISTVGLGVDKSGKRCKLCATSMQGLSGGITKTQEEQEPSSSNTPPPPGPENPTCVNPRFFSGEAGFCRSGGLTILGASCCGISGMFKSMCNNSEKQLRKKRQAGLCVYVGEFCSKKWKIGFAKICVEHKRSYCCFHSQLARILQECGRPQIGKGWGDAKNPDCSGFTIDEFSRVDFTSENCEQAIEGWANQMAQKVGDSVISNIASQVTDRVQDWLNSVRNSTDYGGEK
jgi:conjugal transfer mating pair stabilization protein TraN